ncbi:cytochrome P450 [Portibacter lacus]|uniref:Cytochrome P450 n=1 Tax=Portibacter lacus TaxID=1099794 RepID=A0AA37SUC8_9BACT|nr:cytochrome P450 [Portibacter lacus]GLR19894.1 hypothetical protein GCM10007940_45100 [Portibacter lacus]
MEKLQAWAIWKYNDVDSILTHPNFSAHYIDHRNLDSKLILDQQLAEFRASFIKLLQENHPFIKGVISKVISQEIGIFTKSKKTDIYTAFLRPCCQNISLQLTGIPEYKAEQQNLFGKTRAVFNMTNESETETNLGNNAVMSLSKYFQQLCKERRKQPGNDLITTFTKVEKNVGLLVSPLIQLFVGICESVPLLVGNMLYSLHENPHVIDRLISDVSSHSNELIRYAGPAQYVIRYCVADCKFNGHNFRKGDRIAVFLWSANRDEDIFRSPDTLDLNRTAQANMSFGKGNHACLGASIVREISIHMMEAILSHLPMDQISWAEAEFTGSKTIRGMNKINFNA